MPHLQGTADSPAAAAVVGGGPRKPAMPSLPLLTIGMLGVQCVWSIETAFGAPFLLHLGLSESRLPLVLLAGPLSGLIVQPCIGLMSDASTSRWGRRRPLLLTSCLVCLPSILLFGFARPLAALLGSNNDEGQQSRWTLGLAIIAVFVIDFSINAVGALDRALVLDLVPSHSQKLAHAWCARLAGIGSIIGYFISQVELVSVAPFRWFPSLANADDATETQVRCVCLLAAFLLGSTHVVCMSVAKEIPVQPTMTTTADGRRVAKPRQSVLQKLNQMVVDLLETYKTLSRPMLHIFRIQLFLQSAWYPILFFSTTWVAQIASSSQAAASGSGSTVIDNATALRMGSQAFLMNSILSLTCTLIIPALLNLYNKRYSLRKGNQRDSLAVLFAISTIILSLALVSTRFIARAESIKGAMFVIAVTGFPWALSIWAPSALLGILIRKEAEKQQFEGLPETMSIRYGRSSTSSRSGARTTAAAATGEESHALMHHRDLDEDESLQIELDAWNEVEQDLASTVEAEAHAATLINESGQPSRGATIFGLFNVSIVAPQFFMTLLSTILFGYMEKAKVNSAQGQEQGKQEAGTPNDLGSSDAIVLVLQIGGALALVAAVLTVRLAREHVNALAG